MITATPHPEGLDVPRPVLQWLLHTIRRQPSLAEFLAAEPDWEPIYRFIDWSLHHDMLQEVTR